MNLISFSVGSSLTIAFVLICFARSAEDWQLFFVIIIRVAQSAEAQKRRCTKILVVDENLDPQHTLFCREISFVANYAL